MKGIKRVTPEISSIGTARLIENIGMEARK
jgi:hypothetical protein